MAETLYTSQTPVVGNQLDPGITYTLGTRINPGVAGTVTAIWWYAAAVPTNGDHIFGLFDFATQAELTRETTAGSTIPPSGWFRRALTTPQHVSAGQEIVPAVRTPGRYTFTSGLHAAPISNGGNLSAPASAGRFNQVAGLGDLAWPGTPSTTGYFIDIEFVPDVVDPAEGAAALGLDLAVAAAGARASAAATALGVELGVAAAGARPSAGAAPAAIVLTLAAVGSRPSVGSAVLAVNLAAAAAGPSEPPSTPPEPGGPDDVVTEAFRCKRALFAWLTARTAPGLPLAGVDVLYAWKARAGLECLYGGRVVFTRQSAGSDGSRELWLETATVYVYIRVQIHGGEVEQTDLRAEQLGEVLETLLEENPRLPGNYTFVGIAGGAGDHAPAANDSGPVSVLGYQIQFQYYLD